MIENPRVTDKIRQDEQKVGAPQGKAIKFWTKDAPPVVTLIGAQTPN